MKRLTFFSLKGNERLMKVLTVAVIVVMAGGPRRGGISGPCLSPFPKSKLGEKQLTASLFFDFPANLGSSNSP